MILRPFLRFLCGYDRICCPAPVHHPERLHAALVETLAARDIPVSGMRHAPDGSLGFCVARKHTKRLADVPSGFGLLLCERRGLPALAARYRRRLGIPIGALLFVCLLFYFSQIVWRMDVQTEEARLQNVVTEALAAEGLGAGAWLPGLDLYAASNRLLAACPELSYASIVRSGTTLSVRVRPKEDAPPDATSAPANLVARRDGVIVSFAAERGQVMVAAGQAVRAGELLVGGVVLHRDGSLSMVRASGAVYADTTCSATAEASCSETETTYVRGAQLRREVQIFGLRINFSKRTGNAEGECGTIVTYKQATLFSRVSLPATVRTTYAREAQVLTHTYTQSETVRLATVRALEALRAEMGADASVLSLRTETVQTENGYRVTCTAECVMNIAAVREMVAEEQG